MNSRKKNKCYCKNFRIKIQGEFYEKSERISEGISKKKILRKKIENSFEEIVIQNTIIQLSMQEKKIE